MKDATLAKVAIRAADLFDAAESAAHAGDGKEILGKPWLGNIQGKAAYYRALAHERKAKDALAASHFGEEISHFQAADAITKKAVDNSKHFPPGVLHEIKVKRTRLIL